MDFLYGVLWIAIAWIVGTLVFCWWRGTWEDSLPILRHPWPTYIPAEEAFEEPKPWSRTPLDALARLTHSCRVLQTFPDAEIPHAMIAIVDDTCEEGLPHTSDANTIRIPKSMWFSSSAARRANVLRHERIHLLQRRNTAAWTQFYRTAWNYTLHTAPPAGMPEADKVRGNPDTEPLPIACWAARYWFVPLYTDTAQPRLAAAEVRVWDSQERTWGAPPAAWKAQFCRDGTCPHQWEHPAEIAAELWTNQETNTPASVALRNFILSQQ